MSDSTDTWRNLRRRRRGTKLVVALAAITVVAACTSGTSSGSSGSSGPKPTLSGDAFTPLSGPEAVFGPESTSGCFTAILVINAAGGILGHQVQCVTTDSRGDAADAVPAAQQMLATVPNLIGIVGPSTNEAPSTVSIFDRAHIPMIAQTGDPAFDHNTYKYFYRPTPADDINGIAMAVWAYKQKGFTRAAAVFGNDVAGQGVVPNLVKAFQKLGGTVVANQSLALDQNSYRTEVAQLKAAQPQVIFTELDPQTAGTYYGELKQLNGLVPVIGDGGTLGYPAWLQAVSGAIGAASMAQFYSGVQILNPTSGPGWDTFSKAVVQINITNPSQFLNDPYTTTNYDGVIEIALAITAAKSTDPTKFNPYFLKVATGGPSAVVVHTYADGVAALNSGKTIQFVGAAGATIYDQYHNASLPWEVDTVKSDLSLVQQGIVSASDVAALTS
jgi:ABC-type branched-subunit amino acid transport system substrate-binding protein